MMKGFKFWAIIVYVAVAAGCVPYDLDEVLLSRDDVSLTWKGKEQVVYDPATWQLACNLDRGEFRANDDVMANYFVFNGKVRPSYEGQELTGDVEWTVKTNVKKYDGVRFEVVRMTEDGYIWLWCRSQKIGLTVKELNL